jgi:Fe/S biogenesis protein NfuA
MVEFTERAREMVLRFAQATDDPKVRIVMHGSPFAPQYEFALVEEAPASGDRVVDFGGFKVLLDEASAARMEGATVDWVEGEHGAGLQRRQPQRPEAGRRPSTGRAGRSGASYPGNEGQPGGGGPRREHIAGGRGRPDIYLELGGGCQGCGMARVTLRQGVERMLREEIPELGEVLDVTDHAAGANPYYSS